MAWLKTWKKHLHLFQISIKQCEIGIGQQAFASYRLKLADYLPYMATYEWMLSSRRPKPIASYDTILNPFDYHTWGFTFLSIVIQFCFLIVVQNLWTKISGRPNPDDYIYEGQNITMMIDLLSWYYISLQISLSHLNSFQDSRNGSTGMVFVLERFSFSNVFCWEIFW